MVRNCWIDFFLLLIRFVYFFKRNGDGFNWSWVLRSSRMCLYRRWNDLLYEIKNYFWNCEKSDVRFRKIYSDKISVK